MDKLMQIGPRPDRRYDRYVAVIGVCAVLGCAAGVVAASYIPDAGAEFAPSFSSGFSFSAVLARFLSIYKYHFMAAFLGFTLLGVFLLPAFAAVRGFFFGFSVAAVCGANSFLTAAALFILPAIYSLPAFITMSAMSMDMAAMLFSAASRRRELDGIVDRQYLFTLFVTTAILLLGSALDCWLTPKLFELAAM